MGNAQRQLIASDLVKTIRAKSTVDWWRRDNVRAAYRHAASASIGSGDVTSCVVGSMSFFCLYFGVVRAQFRWTSVHAMFTIN